MSSTEPKEQIDEISESTSGVTPEPPASKSKSYTPLKRTLSEKELLSIGSVSLMIENIERMEDEISSLKSFRDKFHETDKKEAILKEKLSAYKFAEIAYNLSISIGALLVGVAIKLWNQDFYGVLALGCGVALWVSGSIMKLGRMFSK
ncbi:hypothetical protein L8O44_00795 [Enterobacter roggenkampii]|uniref:hypothetical protein n=1 Tax=Enterobacter roggenkampii TaxID=1812935 RepID=UPI002005E8F1|nr:hypothetical protein [Enterobacter roggenkampii]MCK7462459.1 hypothetical protein [Enterobacter roggenkampii]